MTTLGDSAPAFPGPAVSAPAPAPAGPGGIEAPGPPPGPGVVPPFPAPPVEGRGRRVGLGVGLGVGALVLVLGGGAAATVGLTTVATRALNEQADVVVSDYLDALRERRWHSAYDMLCQDAKDSTTEAEFTSEATSREPITDYDVGDLNPVRLSAPVEVTYADGSTDRLEAYLAQNPRTGGFEVCSIEG
ncbi:hypothetical protein [Couchioplanes azureus]|uniref:hypothetical protein n=1 Tax=Couchioplanes caeruleus TaxID=56438 RepID=UPI001993CCC0|nr:hypothetical protein [Couchioplanes caeruleus]GGQ79929.1 hypothetical protein GCM10010166_57590 [Couchioplanes caeruleus subsp. azureus]